MERQIEIVNCTGWVIHDEKVSIYSTVVILFRVSR